MPSISVIVPMYNAELTIERCMESVLSQTFNDFEIIVVDDGSSDNSLALAESLQRQHPQFVKVLSQHNQGAGVARNYAISQSSGQYITFLDSDDYFDCEYLDVMYQTAQKRSAELVLCGHERVNIISGKVEYEMIPKDSDWAPYKFVAIAGKMCSSALLKRSGALFGNGSIGEDVLFSARLLAAHPRTAVAHYAGYKYTLNPASISSETFSKENFHSSFALEKELLKVFADCDKESNSSKLVSFFVQKHIVYNLYQQRKTTSTNILVQEYEKGIRYLGEQGFFSSIRWQKGEDAIVNILVSVTELAYRAHCLGALERVIKAL